MERALPLAKVIEERKRRDTSSQETQSSQGVPRVPQEFPLPQLEICSVSEISVNCAEEMGAEKLSAAMGFCSSRYTDMSYPDGKMDHHSLGKAERQIAWKNSGVWRCSG